MVPSGAIAALQGVAVLNSMIGAALATLATISNAAATTKPRPYSLDFIERILAFEKTSNRYSDVYN